MNSKTIYIVRHGETEFNRKGIVQGSQVDAPLNEKGRTQSEVFFNAYKKFNPDVVYTSTLQRTKESVQSFIDNAPKWKSFSALNEISWGSDDGKVLNDDPLYLDVIKRWANGEVSLNAGNGESPQDVFDRQTSFIKEVLVQEGEGKILICMHGRAMRILFCQLLNKPLVEMDSFSHVNLCLYEFKFENGAFELVRANDSEHFEK
jgi:probable phosphoglycerate mutase